MSFIDTTPRSFGAQPAGPCTSSNVLRAGAISLGIRFEIDADGVLLDGVPFASLAEAEEHLDERAVRLGQALAIRAAKEFEENRLYEEAREARTALENTRESFTPSGVLPEALRF